MGLKELIISQVLLISAFLISIIIISFIIWENPITYFISKDLQGFRIVLVLYLFLSFMFYLPISTMIDIHNN